MVDTLELVKIIRENKNIIGRISNPYFSNNLASNFPMVDTINLDDVSLKLNLFGKETLCNKIIINANKDLLNILVIDCGIKNSQLRALLKNNIQLTIVDTKYNFLEEVFDNTYEGIFISNGPGDPTNSQFVVEQLK